MYADYSTPAYRKHVFFMSIPNVGPCHLRSLRTPGMLKTAAFHQSSIKQARCIKRTRFPIKRYFHIYIYMSSIYTYTKHGYIACVCIYSINM